jgi:hypothetical protein
MNPKERQTTIQTRFDERNVKISKAQLLESVDSYSKEHRFCAGGCHELLRIRK